MSFKIPCGGFKLDEKSFSLDENGVLSVSGGGGEPDFYVNIVDASFDEQGVVADLTLDATNEQIYTAYESGKHVFINMLGLTNAQVQKNSRGGLYAMAFIPEGTEGSRITKLGLYYLEATNPNWRMGITYISATTL